MIKTPDIQDINDVDRFSTRTYYPLVRAADGSVDAVVYIRGVQSVGQIGVSKYNGDVRQDTAMTLGEFLALEQGYYKSRLVEYNGSILYLLNTGADESSRNHSFRAERIRISHHHPEVTDDFQSIPYHRQAMYALSTKRTPAYKAIELLESGKVIGCALSDNFGLITSNKSETLQLVRRSRVIGDVVNGQPTLHPGYDHYFYAVNKLWR